MDDKTSKNEINTSEKSYIEKPNQPPQTAPAVPCQKSSKVVLGILLSVLVILLVGGALALGYLWEIITTARAVILIHNVTQ